MTEEPKILIDVVVNALKSFDLKNSYPDEQRDLQPHIKKVCESALEDRFQGRYHTVISVGGKSKPKIELLGTSIWPDVEITEGKIPVLGIEVKHIRKDESAAKHIEEALGQSLIYSLRYPQTIVFLLHEGKNDPKLNQYTQRILDLMRNNRIELVIRHQN